MNNFNESNLKNIIIIGTGGTIAGKGKEGETAAYSSAQICVEDLVSDIPGLEKLANLQAYELFSIDSCDMTFNNMLKLSKFINEKSKDENIDGFVVTHGTDTLEETSYFLNLTLNTKKPVVLTGSMRPSTATSPDGPFNLYQSIALATKDEAYGKGVLIVFSDSIYGARDICKVNTFKVDAFNHRDLGCLGYMRDNKAYFLNCSTKAHTYQSRFDASKIESIPEVETVVFCPGSNIGILDYISKNAKGIVLAGAGCGGCSEIWNQKITDILKSGVPVVRSSRVGNGLVTYDRSEISEKGIFAGSLSHQKSRVLLALALTETSNLEEIQDIFETY